MTITHGVPKGTILRPLPFKLFMNDLPLHVDSSIDMYADDSTLCETDETVDESNCDKKNVMLFTTYHKEDKLPKKELTVYNDKKNWRMRILKNLQVSKLTIILHGMNMLIKQSRQLVETLHF